MFRIVLVVLMAACFSHGAEPTSREDVTWVCPIVKKGRLYQYRDGGQLLKGVPPFYFSHVIYVSEGKAIPVDSPHEFSNVVRTELDGREMSKDEFNELILPLFYFVRLYDRGQYADRRYFEGRSEGRISALDEFRKITKLPSTIFDGEIWSASFSIIVEDHEASVIERYFLEGRRRPFRLDSIRTEIIDTKIGIDPLMR